MNKSNNKSKKIKNKPYNIQGGPSSAMILPEDSILEILQSLDIGNIVKKTYNMYQPGLSVATMLNVENGEVISNIYTDSFDDMQNTQSICLYRIENDHKMMIKDPFFPDSETLRIQDLFTENEIAILKEKYNGNYIDMCKEGNINIREREVNILIRHAYTWSDLFWDRVLENFEKIYFRNKR